jgi:hypothetical protein
MEIYFTPEAKTTITEMENQVRKIAVYYGENSDLYRNASDSLRRSLVALIGLGGRVSKDTSELSLFCHNEFIAYGVNWSPNWEFEHAGTWSVNS